MDWSRVSSIDEDCVAYRSWKSWDADSFGYVSAAAAAEFRAELLRSGVGGGPETTVLEIGLGNGSFASWAVSMGWGFVGTERDPELVERARRAGLEAHGAGRPLAEIAGGRLFDAVIAFDVLEHLSVVDIIALLKAIKPILKAEGRVIARFPSGDSPFARSIQHGDLTHVTVIGSGIVRQFALITGYRVLQVRAPVLPVTGLGPVHWARRCTLRALRKGIAWLVNIAFHDAQPRIVEPNMVAVLQPMPQNDDPVSAMA